MVPFLGKARYRKSEEIVACILNAARDKSKKTRIMYESNLNYAGLDKYLQKLLDCGLLVYIEEEYSYVVTEAGKKFLDEYAELKDLENRLPEYTDLFESRRRGLVKRFRVRAETE